ncbi:single-stranded DNA-binding protein [Lacticaseibacillus sp. 866-1]|uniref:single-stranded DNA-binding protein n=1 Tax=Lacticaseibacillus sp. 866-1 TaxID=2799576 RepID=UPI001942D312|nr:single-stranded DNA-binding protein [Lacticaseibacillus sp. 866-1]
MLNHVSLTGHLVREVELKKTSSGLTFGLFTLAVARGTRDEQGNRAADFIRAIAWDKRAELMANYLHKGALLGIEGRLQSFSHESREGQRRTELEVVVQNLIFLESRKVYEFRQSQKAQASGASTGAVSFTQADPFDPAKPDVTVPQEDLPF